MFAADVLEEGPVARARVFSEVRLEMRTKVVGHLVVVEQRIVDVEQRDEIMRAGGLGGGHAERMLTSGRFPGESTASADGIGSRSLARRHAPDRADADEVPR